MTRDNERGAAMVIVIAVLAALLMAGGYAVYLQMASTRSSGLVSRQKVALYCAEAGLAAGRTTFAANYPLWPLMLDDDPENDPPWYPLEGDIDQPPDGKPDFRVTIRDNHDELPPAPNDPTRDNDLAVFISSTCIKFPQVPREILELTEFQQTAHDYCNQGGQGAQNAGNTNCPN